MGPVADNTEQPHATVMAGSTFLALLSFAVTIQLRTFWWSALYYVFLIDIASRLDLLCPHIVRMVIQPTVTAEPSLCNANSDAWAQLQHSYDNILAVVLAFFVPATVAGLAWGDWNGGFFFVSVVRLVFVYGFYPNISLDDLYKLVPSTGALGAPPPLEAAEKKDKVMYLLNDPKPTLAALYENVHTPDKLYIQIHNEWYDMAPFAARHPGGEVALRLGAGRDATALFESSHIFADQTKMKALLDKFRMSKEEVERLGLKTLESGLKSDEHETDFGDNVEWTFDGEFRKTVNQRVVEYFDGEAKRRGISRIEATKATPQKWALIIGTFILFLISIALMARGNLIMMIICPLAGWFCGVNAFHDGCHFALSTNPFINSFVGGLFPFFSSPFAWYHQHIIGHHVHCNMEYHDPDLFHGVDIHREHKAHPFRAIYARQAKVLSIVFHFVVGSWLGLGLGSNINLIFSKSQTYNGVIPRIPVSTFTLTLHALSRLMFFIVQFGWPFFTLGPETGFFTKLAYAIVPSMVFSVCFMLNTQINHLTPSAMKEKSLDWTVHQVITAQNFGDPKKGGAAWWFHYLFSGGLNLQMEHHLFPTVNHCHLMVVSEIVERTCAEYGVRYTRVSGYLEGMTEYIKHTTMMSIDADAVETVSKPKPETEVGISKIIRETVKEVAKVDSVPVVVPVPQILKLKEE